MWSTHSLWKIESYQKNKFIHARIILVDFFYPSFASLILFRFRLHCSWNRKNHVFDAISSNALLYLCVAYINIHLETSALFIFL